MTNRRDFLRAVAMTGVAALPASRTAAGFSKRHGSTGSGAGDREYWLRVVEKLGTPILVNLSRRELKVKMPIEGNGPMERAWRCTHLEAFGRLMLGIAPWVELKGLTG